MSLSLLLVAWLLCHFAVPVTPIRLVRLWLLLAGLLGVALTFFWFFTDHQVARSNFNLLVFNPVWWWLAAWKRYQYAGAALLFISLLALLTAWIMPVQYNLDILAAFLPLNIASGLILFRRPPLPAIPPGVPAVVNL
jgi:hypothetical protein